MAYVTSIILVIFSALFSGLNLGLMSLDVQTLKRKMALGDKDAEKVYAIRRRGNLLLCTLLIGNVAVNAVLAVFLGSITTGVVAAIVSTALIVVFGEILPQTAFSRFALPLGAKTAWIVHIFLIVLMPVCWPIAWVLDKAFGDELPTIYSKHELMKIIEEHEDSGHSDLDEEEQRIVTGALSFSDKQVSDVMTPRSVVRAIEKNEIVDQKLIKRLLKYGLSRFPVYEDKLDNVVGMLYLNQLLVEGNIGKVAGEVADKDVYVVDETRKLDDVFNSFIETRRHLFVVVDEFGSLSGVVSLEDVLESIIREEIVDEDDKHDDMRELAKKQIKQKGKKI